MNKETYINLQLANIDHAIDLGNHVIKTSRTLQNMKNKKDEAGGENAFIQDTMKYFSFNDAAASIEFLPLQLKDFKNQIIEIKIANDKMLLEGGFIPAVDKEIASIFVEGDLGNDRVKISGIADTVENAIVILNRLKGELE